VKFQEYEDMTYQRNPDDDRRFGMPGAGLRYVNHPWLAGMVAGVIAGLVMALVAMLYSASNGAGFFLPVKNIAAMWWGVEALLGGVGAVVVGVITHVVIAAILGGIFGLFASRTGPLTALLIGLAYGIGVWLVMTYIALPLVNEVMLERVLVQPAVWFIYHLIFGSVLFITPFFGQAFSTEPTPVYQRT
jgi:hypothetical protein